MKEAYDASTLASLIKNETITSFELVTDSLAKIQKKNHILNAVIHLRTKEALSEAKKINPKTDIRPFAGVPILLKGLGQDLKNFPATSSSILFKDNIATSTDFFVKAIINAGFIILGSTNAPEFGFKNITDPILYGPTKNPWNINYYSGGSSGGAASALAANLVPIVTASDGGGSIRIPASFSGLIGLKPTRGKTPVGPNSWRGWQGASINFGLTRSIQDTAKLLDSLETYQPAAPFSTPIFKAGFNNTFDKLSTKNLTIAYSLKSPVNTSVSKDAINAVLQAVDFLKAHNINTVEIDPNLDGVDLMNSYYMVNGGETAAMFEQINQLLDREVTIDDMELTTWTIYQAGLKLTAADYSKTLSKWDLASYAMDKFLTTYDLFLTPTTADVAPKIIGQPLISNELINKMKYVDKLDKQSSLDLVYDFFKDSLAITPFTQLANLTGQPSISLPTYISKQNLPLGIQFTAKKGNDALLLQIGRLFEREDQFKMLFKTKFN